MSRAFEISGRWILGGMLGLGACMATAQASTMSLQRVTAYDYDPATGLVTREVHEPGDSALCRVMAHQYDAYGNPTKTTGRNCNGSVGVYPGSTAALNKEAAAPTAGSNAVFAPREGTATTTYNADGTVQVVALNAEGASETSTFGVHGKLLKLVGPNGGITEWAYDGLGRKVLEKRADGTGTRWAYAYCVGTNNGQASCAAVGAVVPAYVLTETPLRGPLDLANPSATGTVNGGVTKTYHDALQRVVRIESQGADGTAIYQDVWYDAPGRISKRSRPYYAGQAQYFTVYEYDKLNRVTKVTAPDGGVTTSTYSGLVTTVSVSNGASATQTTVRTVNEAGQLVSVKDANNKTLTHAYDPLGNLLRTIDSAGNQIDITYDGISRKTSMRDPDLGTWTYDYNAAGDLVRLQDAKSQVTTMAYDRLGRMVSKVEPSLNTAWFYGKYADGSSCANGKDKLCESTANNGYSRKNFYDANVRMVKATTQVGGKSFDTTWTYDADGRLKNTGYPSGALTLQNVYSAIGLLHKVVDANNPASVYWRADSRDASDVLLQQTYGNGISTTHAYFADSGRLQSTVAGTGDAVQSVAYTYDLLGNLKTRNDARTGVAASYGYDSLNRLTSESRVGGALAASQAITWAYDDIGNITSRSDVGTYTYAPSGTASVRPHAVTGVAGTVNGVANPVYAYDANGNLTGVTAGSTVRTVGWTSANRVDSITQVVGGNTNKLAYLYGPELDRVQEVYSKNTVLQRTTTYLNQGASLLYEEEVNHLSGAVRKKHYLNTGAGTIGVLTWDGSAWETRYWHKDHLGSLMVVTDGAGAVVERLAYEPFGKRRNANGTTDAAGTLGSISSDRGYTEHEMMDEVGLVNMNGRIYDPAIARFLSADPLVQDPYEMQAYNRYAYAWNNPFASTDPTGFEATSLPPITVTGHRLPDCSYCFDPNDWPYFPGQGYYEIFVPVHFVAPPPPQPVQPQPAADNNKAPETQSLPPIKVTAKKEQTRTQKAMANTLPVLVWTSRAPVPPILKVIAVIAVGIISNQINKQESADAGKGNQADTKGSPDDPEDDDDEKKVPGDNKQFGKKFGEHRDPNRPGYRNSQEYRELANKIYNDPKADRVTFRSDAVRYPGETHITDSSGNLLRLDPQGNFRSLYPIK